MRFTPLPIAGAFRIEIDRIEDERGFFARTFCADTVREHGLVADFPQRSISFNVRRGTLRGLHYQAGADAETKIVRCIRGAAFDVIVDLRRGAPSFGRWHGEVIAADSEAMIYIPAGCAHGFQTLEDRTELYYEIAPVYRAAAARGIAFDDPQLGIAWPLADPVLSPADRARPAFADSEHFS